MMCKEEDIMNKVRQYLAGWDVEISSERAADTDGNGVINTLDVLRLRQYLAGWDVVLGSN